MDLVTFGEAMLRLTPPDFQRFEQAHRFEAYVGGGEFNVAAGAARLGLETRWISRLPENAIGRLVAGRAREHGVDVSQVRWTPADRVGIYFAELGAAPRASGVLYDRDGSAISRITSGDIDWARAFAGARWFHTSGITPALSESAATVTAEALAAAKASGLTVSYDLNFRAKLWTPERARQIQEPMMRHVDVLITTEEDTRVVFGVAAERGAGSDDRYTTVDAASYAGVARTLQDRFGFKAVAITLRENPRVWLNTWSAIVCAGGTIHTGPRYEVEIVDRIGAGDSFSAGLIYGALRLDGWDRSVAFATALSALKHSVPGDVSFATKDEVERLLKGTSLRVAR